MTRFLGILFILLVTACRGNGDEDQSLQSKPPSLSAEMIKLKVGETASISIKNFDRYSISKTVITGCNNIVSAEITVDRLDITALKSGETELHIHPGNHPELKLKVIVSTQYPEEEVFNDATPRFISTELSIDCTEPGVMVLHIDDKDEWHIHSLSNNNSVIINRNILKINQQEFAVDGLEMFIDKSKAVDFLKITLIEGKIAWLVIRKDIY